MYNTTSKYREKIKEYPQSFQLSVDVVFSEGETESAEIPPEDIFTADGDESAFGTDGFQVGSAAAAMFSVKIYNPDGKYNINALSSAQLYPKFTLYDENGAAVDTVPVGAFYTRKINTIGSYLKLDCSDRMEDADNIPYKPRKTRCSLYEISTDIAFQLHTVLSTAPAELTILSKVIDDSVFEGYSLRQVLYYIASASGRFATFNCYGELEYKWFTETGEELRGDWSKKGIELNGNTFTVDGNPVKVTGVSVVSGEEILASVGAEDYLLEIVDNPIAEAYPEEVAGFVFERLKDTVYIPNIWKRIGGDPSLQVGDIVTVIDNKERYNPEKYDEYEKYKLFISQKNWRFSGGFSDVYEAQKLARKNKNKGMTTSKRLNRLKKQISETEKNLTADMDSREQALLMFNEAIAGSMGLYNTVKVGEEGAKLYYMHDKPSLEESKLIYTFGSNGFAWTDTGWNNGKPLWQYGFDKHGNAILNAIYAYTITADVIVSGLLKSKNGASWINMDTGEFCFRNVADEWFGDDGSIEYVYEKVLELANKTLNIYGILRSTLYPELSVAIGKSETGNDGAFTVTDATPGWGDIFQTYIVATEKEKGTVWTAPFLINSAKTNRKGVAIYPNEITLFNDDVWGQVGFTNHQAFFYAYMDNINWTNIKPWVWFNYYPPKYGYAPDLYVFGNGTNGGKANIECAGVNAHGEAKCTSVNSSGEVKCTSVNSSGYGIFHNWITCDGVQVTSDRNLKENIVEKSDVKALEKVNGLNFYSYDFKKAKQEAPKKTVKLASADISETTETGEAPPVHIEMGIMADEAPKEIQTGDGKKIDLYAYISLVAKSVQELTGIVNEQKAKIEELENQLAELKQ